MLVPKRWDPQVLKISPGGALLLDSVSNKCWNSQLLEAVLDWRGLGLLPLVITVAWWEQLERWQGAGHLLSPVATDGI